MYSIVLCCADFNSTTSNRKIYLVLLDRVGVVKKRVEGAKS
jgi:hypothetical protein